MKWANGSEIALKAAEELAVAYNKIAGILSKGLAIEMTTRLEIRQDFVQAVAALDKAFFRECSSASPRLARQRCLRLRILHVPHYSITRRPRLHRCAGGQPRRDSWVAEKSVHSQQRG
jgi:hypothetical protein